MNRSSGILMSITSLPSPYGIGTLGKSAYKFVDFLKAAGQSYWQVLPMGPTSYGDSPYQSFSSFAGNPYMIDLELLVKDKLLKKREIEACEWGEDPARVDYGKIYEGRFPLLRTAFSRSGKFAEEIAAFRKENARWLETYALYMSLKAFFGMAAWTEWTDDDIRLHRRWAVEQYSQELKDDIDFWVFVQFEFYKQWKALREYAHKNGIEFIGDIPIYVAMDSADVWSEPEFFQLDEKNLPKAVAGVPPDAFTADGQLWGNPLYDWEKMREDGFGWWLRRIDGARALYDVIRFDHFRGLESYWAVPYGDTTARNGKWVKGPGEYFVYIIKCWFKGIRMIAEDLGVITPEVRALLDESGFPGMKVMEFAFGAGDKGDYLPHNCDKNSVCYLGTHDNDTIRGWLATTSKKELKHAQEYLRIADGANWNWELMRAGMATCSNLFIMQMQDVLELDTGARMNFPGKAAGNWQWRMLPDAIDKDTTKKIYALTKMFGRLPDPPAKKPLEKDATEETAEQKDTGKASSEVEQEPKTED